jgi:uncharacterized protein (TIGR02147 family)
MIISVYNFTSYKAYLLKKIEIGSSEERGFRTRLVEAVQCQSSYLSQVLNGKPDFTLEQAIRINQFFLHDKEESRYFILLVEFERAGSRELRSFFKEQIDDLQTARFNLKKRLKHDEEIPLESQHKYYSTWFYSAIHIALAIPELQSPLKIAQRLDLPEATVLQVIRFLEENGLVEVKKGTYHFTKKQVHLSRDSEFIQRHHINWRSKTLQAVEKNVSNDLHYSYVFAISQSDFEKVKEIFVKTLDEVLKVSAPSPSEELCALTLDCFKL